MTAKTILELSNVSKYFGGVVANEGISLSVKKGDVVGLIGPNGAYRTIRHGAHISANPCL